MEKKCIVCGSKYQTKNTKSKYCSRECYFKNKKTFNEITTYDNYSAIFIESKKFGRIVVTIDNDDVEKISKYKWHAIYDKTIKNYYICHRYNNKNSGKGCIKIHRLITNCPVGLEVDHINRNTLDNRKENLRVCTRFKNQQNLSSCKSGQTGVYQRSTRNKKWVANITKDKKRIYIGEFKTKYEAIISRKQYERILYNLEGGDTNASRK